MTFTTQFLCQPSLAVTEVQQVTDITWRLKLKFFISIMEAMTTYIDVKDLKLEVLGYYNETINVSLFTFKSIILPIANDVIKSKVNKPFKDGPIMIGDKL